MIKNIRIYNNGQDSPLKDVLIQDGKISIVDINVLHENESWDAQGEYTLMPGLLDAHVHGYGGADFADVGEQPESLSQITAALGQTGLSYAMATLVSLKLATLKKTLTSINKYVEQQLVDPTPGVTQIVGVHLEGPFIDKDCKGAHDSAALQDSLSLAKFEEIISAAPAIKEWKITVAPDLPGVQEFILQVKSLEKKGISVKVFLGHTKANKEQLTQAIKAGAVGFTHLGNACKESCHRETHSLEIKDAKSNLVQWVLENPDSCPPGVELIVDGNHLSESFVQLIHRTVGNKVLLVTDALGPSGLDDGQYTLGKLKIYKEGKAFYLADDFAGAEKKLAGSAAQLKDCIHNYLKWTNTSEHMATIYDVAIKNPRIASLSSSAIQQLPDNKNFSVFNSTGQLVLSLCNGKLRSHSKEFKKNTGPLITPAFTNSKITEKPNQQIAAQLASEKRLDYKLV